MDSAIRMPHSVTMVTVKGVMVLPGASESHNGSSVRWGMSSGSSPLDPVVWAAAWKGGGGSVLWGGGGGGGGGGLNSLPFGKGGNSDIFAVS